MSSNLFNVAEPQGKDAVEASTTAAVAQIDAPTSSIAREVEFNAEQAKDAAQDAAHTAQALGSAYTGEKPSAVEQLQSSAKQTTDAAVAQGHHDVDVAKATSAGYVEQAKNIAANAYATAQAYIPASVGGQNTEVVATLQSGATTVASTAASTAATAATIAYDTTKTVLSSAQATLQPHVETALSSAQATIQPHVDNAIAGGQQQVDRAKGAVQGYLGSGTTTTNTSASSGIPATSAPLESGPHTIGTPYPSTTTTAGPGIKIGENESRTTTTL